MGIYDSDRNYFRFFYATGSYFDLIFKMVGKQIVLDYYDAPSQTTRNYWTGTLN